MHWIDIAIFAIYMIAMLSIGFYFSKKNKTQEDYYVGGREMSPFHIGLSVVATDVGGGFSIGLGGLGFVIGLSGSWMLFTGIIGAWLSAVFVIPKVYSIAKKNHFLSFPEVLKHFYNKKVAIMAGVISLIGYIGFTSSQVLAGAKLASATFPTLTILEAVMLIGVVIIIYTVLGGLKAVIYTDTVQWIILMAGLVLIGLPLGYIKVGGWEALKDYLPHNLLSLTNISLVQFFNWIITIVPIWFVGMTLYQRIFASESEKSAKKAWYIAGVFEWPTIAFMGVTLGLLGRVAFDKGMFAGLGYVPGTDIDPEIGLPLLLRHIFPVGLMGLLMSSYFSAIMSTADSCLMAASGIMVTDIFHLAKSDKSSIRLSQLATLIIGILAIIIATKMKGVLDLMLYSYAFMVSGMFIPVLGALFIKKPSSLAAFLAMLLGGSTTFILIFLDKKYNLNLPLGLNANFFGISLSAITFFLIHFLTKKKSPQIA